MKKVYSTNNFIEANMIADFLNHEGIGAHLQNEHSLNEIGEPCEVWVDNPEDQQKAEEIISDIIEKQVEPARTKRAFSSKDFILGLIAGIVIMALLNWFVLPSLTMQDRQDTWDSNGDGASDIWYEYSGDRVIREISDSDFDGQPDSWYFYSDNGMLVRAEFDYSLNGVVDAWYYYSSNSILDRAEYDRDNNGSPDFREYYQNNQLQSYKADNNFNGKYDEWGAIQNGMVQQSMWSIKEDGVMDKKAFYRHGLKYREFLDLDRDGSFDKQIFYDEFERVTGTEKLQ